MRTPREIATDEDWVTGGYKFRLWCRDVARMFPSGGYTIKDFERMPEEKLEQLWAQWLIEREEK